MEALELARWQFGITTVYHFLQVPLTIGLATLVAIMQTKGLRSGNPKWEKVTEFFGKILLINFALGVATGIVQEFQFGMNWSEYSRFVGDAFGAPLAFEALLAFFLESTFLGLWIFGKGRLSPKVHTLTIWLFAVGTAVSAYFILAANSFMQYPEGTKLNPATGRAELDGPTGFLHLLFNKTSILTFAHTISTAFLVAGTLVAALAIWWMARSVRMTKSEEEARGYWKPAAKVGAWSMLLASFGVILSGHFMGQHVMEIQPAKAAAMMGVCETGESHELVLVMDTSSCEGAQLKLPIPGLESFMATNHFSGPESKLTSLDDVNAELQKKYANFYGKDVDYRPNLAVSFWSFRIMMGIGFLGLFLSVLALWKIRGKGLNRSEKLGKFWVWMIPMPFIGASFGWILTEMGRQPWIVSPNDSSGVMLMTNQGVSGNVDAFSVFASMAVFTLLYTALGVVWVWLIRRYSLEGINTKKKVVEYDANAEDSSLSFVY